MEFKQLDIKPEGSWLKRVVQSANFKRSIVAIAFGAVGGFVFYYLSEGQHAESMIVGEVVKSVVIGGFFGFFITNSPCARGRC